MSLKIAEAQLHCIADLAERAFGLAYPPSHFADLQRGIFAAAKELGFDDPAELADALVATYPAKEHLQALADHLTVGETYFFRDKRSFDILADQTLPALVLSRRQSKKHLRIWCAACCTGEEAYTIAIILTQVIPDWRDWNITLLATDINSNFLRKAARGTFGQWSFRNSPPWLKQYFMPAGQGRFEIVPHVKQLVRFAQLNLAQEVYPSPDNDTGAMDLIVCRNVLMYFSERQATKVLERFHRAQAEGGWLIVGPNELPKMGGLHFTPSNFQGTIFYQKQNGGPQAQLPPQSPPEIEIQIDEIAKDAAPAPVCEMIEPAPLETPLASAELGRSAHELADQGRLSEALDCCDRWIAADRLDSAAHYLRAMILQERGELNDAAGALRTAIYLDPNYVLAHFALANLERRRRNTEAAAVHLRNARKLLRGYRPDELIPEFEGVTAGRFVEVVESLIETETAA
jgi:chemotaxis protein methyltransferase CheR